MKWQAIDDNAKGRTRTGLFVGVLFGPFHAQISTLLLVGVGHFFCLFVLIVALIVALLREVVEETILSASLSTGPSQVLPLKKVRASMVLVLGECNRVHTGIIRILLITDPKGDGASRCSHVEGVCMRRVVSRDLPKILRILIIDPALEYGKLHNSDVAYSHSCQV